MKYQRESEKKKGANMRKKRKSIQRLCVSFVLAVMLIAGQMPVQAAGSKVSVRMAGTYGQTEARKITSMVNEFRTGNEAWYWNSDDQTKTTCKNLKKLKYDYELEKAAMQRAMEIALNFSHTRPDGTSCFTAYSYTSAGENIAAGYTTAKSVFKAWKESDQKYAGQGHRRNMLNANVTAIGIGHVYVNGYHYWVQEFRNPVGSTTKVKAEDSKKAVSMKVQTSMVKSASVKSYTKESTLTAGKSLTMPKIGVAISMQNTWPSQSVSVKTNVQWKKASNSRVDIEDNKIVGKKAGQATITGTVFGKKVSMVINVKPKKAKINALKTVKGQKLKVSWKTDKYVSGYQIQYAIKKDFSSGAKSVFISKNSTSAKTLTKLTKGKKYYVRVRSYKTVKSNGKNKKLYGSWSDAKRSSSIQ